jgi:hypothetical protein
MGKAKHPGRTPAQRRVLDAIGCGNVSPIMSKSTRDALLRAGLIVNVGQRREPFIGGLRMTIDEYAMPTPVHMAWCNATADEFPGA